MHPTLKTVTERIIERSKPTRETYLARVSEAQAEGVNRAHLTCGNLAHAYAASDDKAVLNAEKAPNIGIITAYNDMLSAHQPFETYPALIREAARAAGGTAQVAGGVPAMCDGVTQGQAGMELSLFSRDVIALAAGVGLSHNVFDASIYLGVCDKIVPGLVIAAATFGHIPAVFLPAGPMTSGLPNGEKAKVRQEFAQGKLGREDLMKAEMASYHGPGTCTFYGTANSNQMLMEFMGLHLPGASFVNPGTELRDALTTEGTRRALQITALGNEFTPASEVLDEKTFVNGVVGLMATGGSTNLILHLPAMAAAAGVILETSDMAEIAESVPLMARVYPNGLADVNHMHAAGGLGFLIGQLLEGGLLHPDTLTIAGRGLERYTQEPKIKDGALVYEDGAKESLNDKILKPLSDPFKKNGGLKSLAGNLGEGVMKTSAVDPERHVIEAPARVFENQADVRDAFKEGGLNQDAVIVVRFQGPQANGMPELHSLTPCLSVLQDRGFRVALVTDGRMSGASGKVPAAIHVAPEAASGGPLAHLKDGDMLRVDAVKGTIDVLDAAALERPAAVANLTQNQHGTGRELFSLFRQSVGASTAGASVFSQRNIQ